jgi:hypothetical protein
MDTTTWMLFGVVLVLAANQLVVRIPLLIGSKTGFWGIQLLDISLAVALLIFGLPGFEHYPPVRVILALLLLWHVAQNNHALTAWRRRQVQSRRDEELARRARPVEE